MIGTKACRQRAMFGAPAATLVAVFGSAVSLSCKHTDTQPFWRPHSTYQVTLQVTQKAMLTPELRAAIGEPKDSVAGQLTVDSILGDSLFGTYALPLGDLGLLVVTVKPGARPFAGRIARDTFELELNADVRDASVWLRGTIGAEGAGGTWEAAQRITPRGTFRIRT